VTGHSIAPCRTTDSGSAGSRFAVYRGTAFENVAYKGDAIYIRLPSPEGRRVRRRTTCSTPRQAAVLLERIDALVASDTDPLWWPILAVLEGRVSLERLAHFLDGRTGGLDALRSLLEQGPDSAMEQRRLTPVMPLVDAYAALAVHDAREPGAVLHPRTVAQYVGYVRTAARAMPLLSDWTTASIKAHLDALVLAGPCSGQEPSCVPVAPATYRRHLWALLVFGDYLVTARHLSDNPAVGVAPRSLRGTVRRKQVWLRHAEWVAIIERVPLGVVRDALEFMLATGVEPGATCELTGDKVWHTGARAVIDTNRKGGAARQRTVAVDVDYQQKLARLAKAGGASRVFPGCTVGRLGTVLARVRRELAAEGFAKHALVYPYQLRHTWACESLEAGALVHDVAAQLGHAKVSTTQDCYGPGRANEERVALARAAVYRSAVTGL
jgi:integrase